MFQDTERVPYPPPTDEELRASRALSEEWRARGARLEAQERAVAIVIVLLFVLLVLAGLATSAVDDSPCTLTMTTGYPDCAEDLGPGIRVEWPWSRTGFTPTR